MNLKYASAIGEWQNEAACTRKTEEQVNFHGKMPDAHLDEDEHRFALVWQINMGLFRPLRAGQELTTICNKSSRWDSKRRLNRQIFWT